MGRFVTTGFSDEISPNFLVQLDEIKKMGIAYIEMRGVNGKSCYEYSIDEIIEIKEQLRVAEVKVSAIGSPIGKIPIKDDFAPHFDLFKHTVDLAKLLDTKYIRLFSFFVDKGTADSHREEVMYRMKAMCDYVEGSEIILLHENEKEIYGDTAERCLDLYKTMDSDNFKLIFDPANFVQCGVDTYPHAYNLLSDHVAYMHIKDAIAETGEVVPAGFGDGHLKEILRDLKAKGYEGFLSLEPHLGEFVGFSHLEGDGTVTEFKEKSDASKFNLAHESLKKILVELSPT